VGERKSERLPKGELLTFFSWLKWQAKELFSFFTKIPESIVRFFKTFSLDFLDSRKEISPDWWEDKYINVLLCLMAFFFGGIYALLRIEGVCNQFIIDERLVKPFNGSTASVIVESISSLNVPRPHYSLNFDFFYLGLFCIIFFLFINRPVREYVFWYVPRLAKSLISFLWMDTKRTLNFFKSFFEKNNDEQVTKENLSKRGIRMYSWQELAKISVKDVLKASWLLFLLLTLLFHVGENYYNYAKADLCSDFIIDNGMIVDWSVSCDTMQCLIGNVTINPLQNLTFS